MNVAGGWFGLFSILNLIIPIGIFVFGVYIVLQLLKETRDRNDLLYQILDEMRKSNKLK